MREAPKSHGNLLAAHTLVKTLVQQGIAGAVLSPGSRNTPLVLALEEQLSAGPQVVLDERAAGFVALGMARASRKPAVLVCTSGSAGAHYLPAVLEARYGRVPLIVLTADRPAELHHCGAGQTISQSQMYGDNPLWSADIPAFDGDVPVAWIAALATQARAASEGSPAGPVHINMAFREPLWEEGVASSFEVGKAPRSLRGSLRLRRDELQELAAEMQKVERGAFVCGPWAPATLDSNKISTSLSSLAEALGWPIFADAASGIRFGRHGLEHVMGAADSILRDSRLSEDLKPDFVLAFGQAPTSKAVGKWLSSAQRIVLVDPDGLWQEPGCQADTLVTADPVVLCSDLSVMIHEGPGKDSAWLKRWGSMNRQAQEALDKLAAEGTWEAGVAGCLVDSLPDGAQFHMASSLSIRAVDSFGGVAPREISTCSNRGCNGIDGTIATAAGAALFSASGPTVVLLGDLAFLHDLTGLEAACQLGASLTFVVVNNEGGGIFDHLPIAQHPSSYEPFFVTKRSASIADLCLALGARHSLVENLEALKTGFLNEVEKPGVGVIEIRVDREFSVSKHKEAWARVSEALSALKMSEAGA